MPIAYNPKTKRYEIDGVAVDRDAITALVRKLTGRAAVEAKRLAKRLEAGSITQSVWHKEMLELLTSGHITAAIIGRGGRSQMAASTWKAVEDKIQWQGQFLKRFGSTISAKAIKGAAMERRAASYADPMYISYTNAFQESQTENAKGQVMARLITNSAEGCEECAADEAEGWMPIDEMNPIGSRICGDFCRCQIEFSDESGEGTDFTSAAVNLVFGVSE